MKIENIVTKIETSRLLAKTIGHKKALFSYYKNSSGDFFIAETNLSIETEFECYCYTFSEILSFLPGTIEINSDTYIAGIHSYEKLKLDEGRDYEIAYLEVLKADQNTASVDYIARYTYKGRVIAFGQNQKGKYKNLFRSGETETEALAAMFLALIEEEIVGYHA